jgi:hypothetical protein
VLGDGEETFLPASFVVIPALLPGEDLQAGNAPLLCCHPYRNLEVTSSSPWAGRIVKRGCVGYP